MNRLPAYARPIAPAGQAQPTGFQTPQTIYVGGGGPTLVPTVGATLLSNTPNPTLSDLGFASCDAFRASNRQDITTLIVNYFTLTKGVPISDLSATHRTSEAYQALSDSCLQQGIQQVNQDQVTALRNQIASLQQQLTVAQQDVQRYHDLAQTSGDQATALQNQVTALQQQFAALNPSQQDAANRLSHIAQLQQQNAQLQQQLSDAQKSAGGITATGLVVGAIAGIAGTMMAKR